MAKSRPNRCENNEKRPMTSGVFVQLAGKCSLRTILLCFYYGLLIVCSEDAGEVQDDPQRQRQSNSVSSGPFRLPKWVANP